jgi:hypothetical protein
MVNVQLLVRGNETKAVEVDNQTSVAEFKVPFPSQLHFLISLNFTVLWSFN